MPDSDIDPSDDRILDHRFGLSLHHKLSFNFYLNLNSPKTL